MPGQDCISKQITSARGLWGGASYFALLLILHLLIPERLLTILPKPEAKTGRSIYLLLLGPLENVDIYF